MYDSLIYEYILKEIKTENVFAEYFQRYYLLIYF